MGGAPARGGLSGDAGRDVDDLTPVKGKHGVPPSLRSCHTAVVEGYVIEGHVPADLIDRLLRERPKLRRPRRARDAGGLAGHGDARSGAERYPVMAVRPRRQDRRLRHALVPVSGSRDRSGLIRKAILWACLGLLVLLCVEGTAWPLYWFLQGQPYSSKRINREIRLVVKNPRIQLFPPCLKRAKRKNGCSKRVL